MSYLKIYIVLCFSIILCLLGGCQSSQTSNSELTKSTVRVSDAETDAAEASIATDKDGKIYVAFVEHGTDKSSDLFLRVYDKEQKPVGAKVQINPEKGQVKTWYGDAPIVKVGNDGAVYVSWTAKVADVSKTNATNLFLSVSRDGGKTFAAPVKVNDDTAPASHGMHSLAVSANNNVYLAWLDERNIKTEPQPENAKMEMPTANEPEYVFIKAHHTENSNQQTKTNTNSSSKNSATTTNTNNSANSANPVNSVNSANSNAMKQEMAEPNSEVFYAVSKDGGKTFAPNAKLSSEVCPCCKTSLAIAPDGRIYASWRQVMPGDFRHIAVSSSADGGNTFTPYVIVSDDQWQINACPVSGAAMNVDSNNTLRIAWYSAGKAGAPGLYSAESSDGGKTFTPRQLMSEQAGSGAPSLFRNDKGADVAVFPMMENKIGITQPQGKPSTISDAQYPSAIIRGDTTTIVYIRKIDGKQSVWLTSRN